MVPRLRTLYQTAACVMALGIALAAAGGEIYRWTDEQGNVHYGDRPAGAGAEAVEVAPAPATQPGADERRDRRRKLLDVWEEEKAIEQRAQEQAEAERARRARNCRVARRRLEMFRRASLLYEEGADGQRRYFSDAERQQALEQARAAVTHWCR